MPAELALTWPAAFAIVAGIVAAGVGLNTLMTTRRDVTSQNALSTKVADHESRLKVLETTLSGQVETKFKHVEDGIARVEGKLDTLVSEVVAALAAVAGAIKKD